VSGGDVDPVKLAEAMAALKAAREQSAQATQGPAGQPPTQ